MADNDCNDRGRMNSTMRTTAFGLHVLFLVMAIIAEVIVLVPIKNHPIAIRDAVLQTLFTLACVGLMFGGVFMYLWLGGKMKGFDTAGTVVVFAAIMLWAGKIMKTSWSGGEHYIYCCC